MLNPWQDNERGGKGEQKQTQTGMDARPGHEACPAPELGSHRIWKNKNLRRNKLNTFMKEVVESSEAGKPTVVFFFYFLVKQLRNIQKVVDWVGEEINGI